MTCSKSYQVRQKKSKYLTKQNWTDYWSVGSIQDCKKTRCDADNLVLCVDGGKHGHHNLELK